MENQFELAALNSERQKTTDESNYERSGIFHKCTDEDWCCQLSFWKYCSLSICPTYKQFAKFSSLILISILTWAILYGLVPNLVKPGGKIFDLFILTLSAYFSGLIISKLSSLPGLIGMLLIGILFQNINIINLEGEFARVTSELRRIALVIILTRAGLSLDQSTMRKMFATVLKLGLIPWIAEFLAMGLLGHYVLKIPLNWALLLSCIIASVSPAVVVPCFIRFQNKGYGVDKGIPTLILAAATIDDTTSITVYGIISSVIFSDSNLLNYILQGPIAIISGIAAGILWGYILAFIPERNDSHLIQFRTILLFLGGYAAVLGSGLIGYAGAGPLAVVSAAFVSGLNWNKQGWNTKTNPVASSFRSSWILFEPILFGLTGTQVRINELDSNFIGIGAACLFASILIRIIVTIIICCGGRFNKKESIFIGLSWMAKATVQAALGPLALETVKTMNGTEDELKYGNILLTTCILSIILTAPLGAVLIAICGPKLLTRSIVETDSNLNNTTDVN